MEHKRRLILTGEKLDDMKEEELATLDGILGRFGLSSEVETIELDTEGKLGKVNLDELMDFAYKSGSHSSDLTNRVHSMLLGNCVRGHAYDPGQTRRKGVSLEIIDVRKAGERHLWLVDLDKLKAALDSRVLREAVPGFGPKSVGLLNDYVQSKLVETD